MSFLTSFRMDPYPVFLFLSHKLNLLSIPPPPIRASTAFYEYTDDFLQSKYETKKCPPQIPFFSSIPFFSQLVTPMGYEIFWMLGEGGRGWGGYGSNEGGW